MLELEFFRQGKKKTFVQRLFNKTVFCGDDVAEGLALEELKLTATDMLR